MKKASSIAEGDFFTVFNACPTAMAVMRLSDGCCLAANESFTALTGLVAAQMAAAAEGRPGAWLSLEDWQRLSADPQPAGRTQQLAVTLRTKAGATLARVSARQIEFDAAPSLLALVHNLGLRQPAEPAPAPTLRQWAEVLLQAADLPPSSGLPLDDPRRMLHELQVHQIELEMQNDELRKTQAELRASSEHYIDLYDLAPVGYLTLSAAGLIQAANLKAASLLAVTRGTLVNKAFTRFVSPDDQTRYSSHRQQLAASGLPEICELRLLRADESAFWARLEMAQTPGADGAPVCRAVISDITAQKQAEAALRASEAKYKRIIETAGEGIWTVDAAGQTDFINARGAAILGFAIDEVLGHSPAEFVFPDEVPYTQRELEKNQRGERLSEIYRMRHKSGREVWVKAQTAPIHDQAAHAIIGSLSIFADITEQKQAEAALRASERKWTAIFEKAPFACALSRLPEGVLVEVNQAFEQMYGHTRQEALGQTSLELGINPDEAGRARLRAELQATGSVHDLELVLQTKANGPRVFLVNLERITLGDQDYSLQMAIDITARQEAQAEIRRLNADLERRVADRTAALQRREQQLRTVLDTIPEIVFAVDPAYRLILSNQAFEKLALTDASTQGKPLRPGEPVLVPLYPPEFRALWKASYDRALRGEAFTLETSAVWMDGTHYFENYINPIVASDHTVSGVVVMSRDITQRQQAETALRESLTKYQVLFEAFPLGITIADAEGNILERNRLSEQLLGLPPAEQERRKIDSAEWQIVRPDGSPMPAAEFAGVRALQEHRLVENTEMGIVGEQGQVTWISVTAAPLPLPGYGAAIAYSDITLQRRAQLTLQEREHFISRMMDVVPVIVYVHDLVTRRELFVNQRLSTVLGYTASEAPLPGTQGYLDSFHPDDVPVIAGLPARYAAARDGEIVEAEYRVRDRQGAWHWLHNRDTVFARDASGAPCQILGVATDITPRKLAQAALAESEGRFRAVLENALDAAYRRNLQLDHYDYLSPVIEQILGWTVAEMTEADMATILGRMHPDDLARVEQEMERTEAECRVRGRANGAVEYRFLCKDGQYRWMADQFYVQADSAGRPIYRGGIFRDITARKQAEEEIRQLNENLERRIVERTAQLETANRELRGEIAARRRVEAALERRNRYYEQMLQTSMDAFHILDIEGHLLEWNPAFLTHLGYTDAEAAQLKVGDWDLQWNSNELLARITDIIRQGQRFESSHRRKDGAVRQVEINASGFKADGEWRLFASARDITERVRAQEARQRAEDEIRQLNADLERRVAARTAELQQSNAALTRALQVKNEFLAVMSHELRTPLTAVLGLTETMQMELFGPLTPKQRKSLETIYASGQHLLGLLTDVLEFVAFDGGRLQLSLGPVDVADLCRASLHAIHAAARQKKLQISTELDAAVDVLRGDGSRLKKLLVKLLDNAVKFTPEGGEIGLAVTGDAVRQEVRFAVWDSGIGIARTDQARIFEPFVQMDARLSRHYEGTGLGLALAKRLAEVHGGRVTVESEGVPGQGSRFTVYLPWNAQ